MLHYLNVCDIKGDSVPPVDIITFGSPCQDLSVAGKRAGLKHAENGDGETTRSGLFMEAVRIIKEMRNATNNDRPRFAVWENVPGAFSSGKGEDFRIVLEALCSVCDDAVSIPKPYDPKRTDRLVWNKSGEIVGDNYSIAWRTLDAQYWGVPQRRKRIFLVADFAGQCAGKVLFESEGVSGYTPQGFRSWQATPGGSSDCPGATGFDGYNGSITGDKEATLGVNCGMSTGRNGIVLNDQGGDRMDVTHDVTSTLRAGVVPATVYENHSQDTRYTDTGDVAPTVLSSYGTGGNNQPFVVGTPIVSQPEYTVRRLTPTECSRLQGFPDTWGHIGRKDDMTDEEVKFWNEVYVTHQAIVNGKCVPPKTKSQLLTWYNKLWTDSAEYKAYGNGLALPCAEFVIRGIAEVLRNEKGQFASKGGVIEHKGYTCIYKPEHPRAKTNGYVREHILVAEETLGRPLDGEEVVHHINGDKADNRPENLEIFPTHAEHVRHHNRTEGKKYSYNGGEFTVAELSEFSVVDYSVLTQRINKLGWDIKRAVETPKRGQPTLGSLFDGIGGFPLAATLEGIEPVWCSEIEPYPIAVTMERFLKLTGDDKTLAETGEKK